MGRGREGTPGLNSEDPYVQCQVEEKDPANRLRRRGQRGRRMIQERGMRWMPRKKICFKREAARLLEMLLNSQMTRRQGTVFGAGHRSHCDCDRSRSVVQWGPKPDHRGLRSG